MIKRETKLALIDAFRKGNLKEAKNIKQEIEMQIKKEVPHFATLIHKLEDGKFEYQRIFVFADQWNNSDLVIQRLKQYRFTEITEELWEEILEGCTPKSSPFL